LLDYYTVDEVAAKSGLNIDQVLRLGMAGTIIFSILEHQPRNYEEVDEFVDEEGRDVVRTRRNETTTLFGNPNPGLQVKYIATEDVINVVTNTKTNKNTLIRGLFETRELEPKKGKFMLNCPLSITQDDLVITTEEWELFERNGGKRLASYLPLAKPEKVTIKWLLNNISVGGWVLAISFVGSVFTAGVYFSDTKLYEEIKSKVVVGSESNESLNK